jgi:hypothetical protein
MGALAFAEHGEFERGPGRLLKSTSRSGRKDRGRDVHG